MNKAQPASRPTRIVVVEDSEDILFIMKVELEEFGYMVEVARDALTALELSARFKPDVIISDIGMPGIDGIEFIRRLRRTSLRDVPVIALSGYSADPDLKSFESHGFSAHLTKPVDPGQLDDVVQALLRANKSK